MEKGRQLPGGGGRVDIEYDDIPDPDAAARTTATTLLFALHDTYDTHSLSLSFSLSFSWPLCNSEHPKHTRAPPHGVSTPALYTPAFYRPPYVAAHVPSRARKGGGLGEIDVCACYPSLSFTFRRHPSPSVSPLEGRRDETSHVPLLCDFFSAVPLIIFS